MLTRLCTCTRTLIHFSSTPKLWTEKDGKVKFHPKSVNCEEVHFDNKFMIYHTKVKSSAVFIHDASMIPPFPLLFFGGRITVSEDLGQETIVVDDWIVFQAPRRIAELVKVHVCIEIVYIHLEIYIKNVCK